MSERLFGQVTELTGLPQDLITEELNQLLSAAGVSRTDLTLDDLREILAEYVQDVLLQAQNQNDRQKTGGHR